MEPITMTNWQTIISDLKRHGITAKAIERLSGVQTRTVYELTRAHMVEPRHSDGQRLLDLHDQITKIVTNRLKVVPTEEPA